MKMETLLAYRSSSEDEFEETEQSGGHEESNKKRKVTEVQRENKVFKETNTRQLENKRPKPFLASESAEVTEVTNNFPDAKHTYTSCRTYNLAPVHDRFGVSNDFGESHSVGSPERNDKKFVPSVSSTVHSNVTTTITSRITGGVARPYISKREKQKLVQETVSHASSFPLEPEQEVAVFDSIARDNEGTSNDMCHKKQDKNNRPPKQLFAKFEGHSRGVACVRWHPTRSNLLLSAALDHMVCVWDTSGGGNCSKRLKHHTAAVKDSKWSLCGSYVLSCGYDKTARLVNLETGKEIIKFPHHNYVTCVQFHPTDPTLFLAGTFNSAILCWDTRTGSVTSTYSALFGQVQDIAFLPRGNEFISAAEVIRRNSTDKGIMVWDFKSTAVLSNQIYQEAFTCTCLKVHPCESHFVAQSSGDYIALFSTRKPYKLNKFKRYEGHKVSGYHIGCDFSPDGSIICSGSADGQIYFYNHHTSHLMRKLEGHAMPCMDVTFHPTLPHCIASCGWDGGVKVWK